MAYEKEIKVLDKGFVRYIDHMGSDQRILEAARVSYKSKGKGDEADKKLLSYLYKNHHCYHPSMEVLTATGWKKWSDCNEYENFMIPDPTTKKLSIERLKLLSFDVEDELMEGFNNNRMNYLVTGNHRMWFKKKCSKRYEVFEACKMNKWGNFESGVLYSVDENVVVPDKIYQLIGFYLGDGFSVKDIKNRVFFRLVKKRKIEYLKYILDSLNIEYKEKKCNTKTSVGNDIYQFSLSIKDIPEFSAVDIKNKAAEKSFNKDILKQLSPAQLSGLLDGLINSDGSIKKDRPAIEFSSMSIELAKLFESLASFFNYESHFVKKFSGYNVKLYYRKDIGLEARKQYFFQKKYTGKVYCTTSSTGLLMVRGSNTSFAFVCGNSSPFEMCKLTMNIKMPIFIMRQYVRHRMQNLNEVSARYTELPDEFYIPEEWRKQDTKNKQGSVVEPGWNPDILDPIEEVNESCSAVFKETCENCYKVYKSMLEAGISREMARMVLPVNIYTEFYTTWDLKNLLHFIKLRDDNHAQYEIQQYGKAIREILTDLFPWTMEAFDKYKFAVVENTVV